MSSGDLWDALQRTAPLFDNDHVGELPQVVANMVVSADGATTVAGHVGGLTSESDQTLLHRLRSEVDAVLVGSATALAEGYGALLPEGHDYPRGERQPRLVVLTSRPHAFEGEPALEDTGSDIVFVTSPDAPLPA